MIIRGALILFCLFQVLLTEAQGNKQKWWSPKSEQTANFDGQGWEGNEIGVYNRLPYKAEQQVRKEVWDLSQNSAGLNLRFKSNSSRIVIRYKVSGSNSMPHMPATGVSGVDLYTKIQEGDWSWCKGNYVFGDTICYEYENLFLPTPFHQQGREYRLFLPLYNTVTYIEIGVPEDKTFKILPLRQEKPIVVYGTSIAQGACASRPGMAWTSILSRQLAWPVVNLGFSGNGRLEMTIIDLMTEIDAKLYVLDCLPNMMPWADITEEETYTRIKASVKHLKSKQPDVPILLTEHAGFSDGVTNKVRSDLYKGLNVIIKKAFSDLLEEGFESIYLLTKEELALSKDAFVDGTHPSDIGMQQYARAYETLINQILIKAQ